MSTIEVVLFVVALVLGILVIIRAVWAFVARGLRRQLDDVSVRWREQGLTIVKGPESANYRGHLSKTVPVRGNGILALTTLDLRFVRLAPPEEFVVPLADITRVVIRRVWQGSYRGGTRVMGIYYRDASLPGGEDAIGLIVRDPADWARSVGLAANVPFEAEQTH